MGLLSGEGIPGGANGKESACQCRRAMRCGFDPWVGKIPWRRTQQRKTKQDSKALYLTAIHTTSWKKKMVLTTSDKQSGSFTTSKTKFNNTGLSLNVYNRGTKVLAMFTQ